MVRPAAVAALVALAGAGSAGGEEESYRIVELPAPAGVVLEVGGIAFLPDGRPLVCTRRGELYVVENAFADEPAEVAYRLFAQGLQEPLGLLVHDGWIYTAQRGELSRLRDLDGDDRVDELETVCDAWRISGNYHEYNFGPALAPDGALWITTNKPFGDEPFGRVDWRGFALRITPEGRMEPAACGLRSPAGLEFSPWGELFYTDNQGEWCGASKLSRIEPGSFHGHPWGIFSCLRPEWRWGHPGDPPDGLPMPAVRAVIPSFELPAVWFPYEKMGNSPAGFVWDRTEGRFGPFDGQVLVGDQHHSSILRVSLERVNGHWQGACYPFREGFASGLVRLAFAPDDSLFVGMTNRGWGSRGGDTCGLARLVWTGCVPFEIHSLRARPDGFVLRFTEPVEREVAARPETWQLESYTYLLHSDYGSPETDRAVPVVGAAQVSADGLEVRLVVDGLRAGYVHELHALDLCSAQGRELLHPEAYYTLIERPAE